MPQGRYFFQNARFVFWTPSRNAVHAFFSDLGSPISNFRFRKILEFPAIFLRKEMRCIPKITLSSHLAAPRIRLRAQKAKNFSEIWVRVHFPDFEMRPTSSCHFKFCFHFYQASGSCLDSRLSKISNYSYKVLFRLVTIKWRYRLHNFIPKLGLSGEENHIIHCNHWVLCF